MGVALRSAASRRAMGLRSSAGCTWELLQYMMDLVAEVVREHGGPPPKSLDSDQNFKPEHTLYCCELRFVAIFGPRKCLLGSKTVCLGQEVHYDMVCIRVSQK